MSATVYATALGFTFLVEAVLLWPWMSDSDDMPRAVLAVLGANAFTHGALWHLWPVVPFAYLPSVLVGEALVSVVEAAALSRALHLSPVRAAGLSLLVNAASTLVGLSMLHAA